jgi:Family of unknown function (DUF5309)
MAILGLRGTGDWGPQERPTNFRETILWRQPNGMAPLTALMSQMGSESTNDPQFSWWEEELDTIRVTTSAAYLSTDTAIVVTSGATNLVPGDLLMVEKADQVVFDNELVEVATVTDDTHFTINRGAAGSTAAAIASGAALLKIGNNFAEGTGAPTASTRNPTKLTNYCQIFKTTYDITNTAKNTYARTGDPLKNDKKRKMFDHSVALEWAFMLGRPSELTGTNGKPKRTTGGLRSFMQSNVTVFGGGGPVLGTDTFLAAITPVFNYNSQAGTERMVLCGNGALNALNKLALNSPATRLNSAETIKLWGMQLTRWVTPQGDLLMKTHPLLNVHPVYTYSMFVIDPAGIRYRFMRDTTFKDNIQAPDADTQMGQWLTEAGMEVNHEKTMAYLGNVK